jgi:heptose I phosphotransferase
VNTDPPRTSPSHTLATPRNGSFWDRLVRGSGWTWIDDRYKASLPRDIESRVMGLESHDRHHAKQGRSTARFVFHEGEPAGGLSVYLKRHYRLPWGVRLAALLNPGGAHTPGAAEWRHLRRVRALGIAVPEVVAAGERVGPWAALQGFLMLAELTGSRPLHEAIPELARRLDPRAFAAWKRRLAGALAEIAATLHRADLYHKDFYLCHFFLDERDASPVPDPGGLTLIDLHRLGRHPWRPNRWRWKDLGQLLYSTYDVAGVDDRDRLRFWHRYRKRLGLRRAPWHARMISLKAARYRSHNAKAV